MGFFGYVDERGEEKENLSVHIATMVERYSNSHKKDTLDTITVKQLQ